MSKQNNKPVRFWLWFVFIVLAVSFVLGVTLVALPVVAPSLAAKVADLARSVVGPQPIAFAEGIAFRVEDLFNQVRYQLGSKSSNIAFSTQQSPDSTPTPSPTPDAPVLQATTVPTDTQPQMGGNAFHSLRSALIVQNTPAALSTPSVVDAPPALTGGWEAFGSMPTGTPLMARGVVSPDPGRPYAQVALVRFDLSQTSLHMMAGRTEPVAPKGAAKIPRPGVIPLQDQSPDILLAAFNGGFKAINGHFGMMVDGNTILPPIDNLATLVIHQDGSIQIGAWGRDFSYTPDMAAYRQNCPLLIDAGNINPEVYNGNFKEWGQTVKNVDATWRSGVGISKDGRFLIYAVGNSLTVDALARALQEGGSYYAMQLDINNAHIRFVNYGVQKNGSQTTLVANKLFSSMVANPDEFLAPYDRDFFYVTVKGK